MNFLSPSHVVGGGRGYEDDGRHVVEALNPLPPLVALPAHVKHVELDLVHAKLRKERKESMNFEMRHWICRESPERVPGPELTAGE